jgi:hypothetical protein
MPKHRRVSVAVRVNESRFCDIRACTQHRNSLSRWCSRHSAAAERNGDPLAKPIAASNWAPLRASIRQLYADNEKHPGLTRALQWVSSWMAQAVALDGREHWASEVARVHRHGCSATDVLVELAACWSYLQENPRAITSDSHRDNTLSKAVCGLAPRPRRVSPEAAAKGTGGYAPKAKAAALKHIGPHLVRSLAPLLVTTHQSIETEQERARAQVEAMRLPFNPTNKAIAEAAQAINERKNQQ